MKVVLVFRDKRRGGKSIEGVFQPLLSAKLPGIQLHPWEYNMRKSFFSNLADLKRTAADIIHITGDINHLAAFLPGKKVIITIHDIGRYKELQGIKKWIYGLCWIRQPIANARQVTTVSEYTRNEVVRLVPSAEKKIQVIYNGTATSLHPVPKPFSAGAPRILQVGTAQHKNIETLIKAAGASSTVVVIGQLSKDQLALLHKYNVQYENFVDLDQSALQKQYELADIVVFVSTHEGFGLPIIEAQAIGRPVITTRMAAIPEVAGKGAHYVKDPFDEKELRSAIDHICTDEAYRHSLIQAGIENSNRFSMDHMISAYEALYRKVDRS